jgi:hypothetical protein
MPTARFCSECGERLRVTRSSILFAGSYCRRCSRWFQRVRLTTIVAVAASLALGFVAGRFTTPREAFYYIGTPVESGSLGGGPPADRPSSQSREARAQAEQPVFSLGATENNCGARTKSGRPCQRKVKGGGYCWQHRDKAVEKKSHPAN